MILSFDKNKFYLRTEDNSPLIFQEGKLIDYSVSMLEFDTLRSLDEYLERNNLKSDDWEKQKEDYFNSKSPQWNAFNLQIINDNYFQQLYNKIYPEKSLELSTLPLAIVQYAEGKSEIFRLIYSLIHQSANLNEIAKWCIWAEECNLPYSFQKIINNPS